MDAASFFESQAPRALDEAGPLFQLGLVYVFAVTGDGGGTWTLDLGPEPGCRKGRHESPDCSLELSAPDLERMLADPAGSRHLFYEGRIRVAGRFQAAAHLPGVLRLLSAPSLPGGLGALLGAFPVEEFLDRHWPERSLVVHEPPERTALSRLAGLGSAEELLERWPGRVRLGDRRGGRLVPRDEARRLYSSEGEHLAFSDVEHVVTELQGWLERLRWELGLPLSCHGRCLVYASPGEAGEVLHFDQNANFVLQLRGHKLWRIAPNPQARRPTTRYTSIAPAPEELGLYAELPLPTRLPPDAEEVRLRPGSLLFLPRGYWHETRAAGESLSLNFTFDQPCWADVVMPEIRRQLLKDERWRELARGAGAPRRDAAAAGEARLRELIAGLAHDLEDLDAAAAIGHLLPARSRNPTESEPETGAAGEGP